MAADFAGALEGLKQRFLRRAAEDLDVLTGYLADAEVPAESLRFTVHRLAGAASTFGWGEVGDTASRLDLAWQSGGPIDRAEVETLIAELRRLPAARPD